MGGPLASLWDTPTNTRNADCLERTSSRSRKSPTCRSTGSLGETYRDPRFSSDAGHASHTLEAHGAGRARDAIYAAGAIGALDALRAQLPATAGLEGNRSRKGSWPRHLQGLLPQSWQLPHF